MLGWPDSYPSQFYPSAGGYKVGASPRGYVNPAVWSGPAYHVDPVSGNNSNTGLGSADGDFSQAVKAINNAVTKGNATSAPYRVIVKAGEVGDQANTINGTAGTVEPTQHCAFIGWGGRVIHAARTTITWSGSPDVTHTNCYTAALTSAIRVCDRVNLSSFGDYTDLTGVADAATANSTPNSWAIESNTIYVHRSDALPVTETNTRVFRNINVARFLNCTTDLYFENFDFEGGPFGGLYCDPVASRNIVTDACTFKYAGYETQKMDGCRIRRTAGLVYHRNGIARANWKDGFNYHRDDGSGVMYVLHDNCIGSDNGRGTSSSNNGFALHDDVIGIDVNGVYEGNFDGADVHIIEDSKAWCLGTRADCNSTNPNAAFKSSNDAELWLQDCEAESVDLALYAQSDAGKIHKRRLTTISGTELVGAGASIDSF